MKKLLIWIAVGAMFLGFIAIKVSEKQKTSNLLQESVARRLSPWHVQEIEKFFTNSSMKPARWGVGVEDVRGTTISMVFTTLDRYSKEEAELNLRYMCPPDDARLWYGLNEKNVIYMNVRYPLDLTSNLGWWKCEGPKAKAADVSGTAR